MENTLAKYMASSHEVKLEAEKRARAQGQEEGRKEAIAVAAAAETLLNHASDDLALECSGLLSECYVAAEQRDGSRD